MTYEKEIVNILLAAGRRGLPVAKIARHVHHEVNSLFEQVSYEEVHRSVGSFVRRHAHTKSPLFKHTSRYGYYRLNKRSARYKRLLAAGEANIGGTMRAEGTL